MNKLLDSAIDEIERVLLGNKDRSVEEVYMKNAIRFIREFSKQPTLNENQQIVLEWLKEQYAESNLFPIEVTWLLIESVDKGYFEPEEERAFKNLNNLEEAQVLQAFSQWALEHEEE